MGEVSHSLNNRRLELTPTASGKDNPSSGGTRTFEGESLTVASVIAPVATPAPPPDL
jgi:hypothetical protein